MNLIQIFRSDMLKCKECGLLKDPSFFYSSNKSRCKDCVKASVRKNRVANIEHYREFDRLRSNYPKRVSARRDYSKTEAGKVAGLKAKKKYTEANPKKRSAHIRVGNAIRDGILVKKPCSVCQTTINIVAHHCDYDRQLDIMWLCAQHHSDWHAMYGEGLNA